MSQLPSLESMMAASKTPRPVESVRDMTDAMLADEHRGQSFAYERAKARRDAIEAELDRRGLTSVRGTLSCCTKHPAKLGLLDLTRLRAELPAEILAPFELTDTRGVWRSRTLGADERA